MRRLPALAFVLPLLLVLVGCGADSSAEDSAATAGGAATAAPTDYDLMRDKVVLGLAKDFRAGTDSAPAGYATCVRNGLRRALGPDQLNRLASVYRRPAGQAYAAQALTQITAPIGAECGGAKWVPEPIFASEALGGRYPLNRLEIAARRLGVTYGPFLGVTCRPPGTTACDSIGIDLVLRADARALTAWVAGRKVELRTPGLHSGRDGRDWVGYLDHVGLERSGSRFELPSNGGRPNSWAGSPAVYLPVRLEVTRPDGGSTTGSLPRVFLSPGWG